MKKIQKLFSTPIFNHHVYGFESHGLRPDDFNEFIDRKRFSYVFSKHYDSFKINDARNIKSLGVEKTDKESLFIISFTHINRETQNTLLKMIEEPKSQTTFFFIFPNAKKLLPTILSRLELLSMNRVFDTQKRKIIAIDFIKMTLNERFILVKSLTGKLKKGEPAESKLNKFDTQSLLDDLEIFYFKQKPNEQRNQILKTILKNREYINTNGASIKMILDNVAMNL